MAIDAAGNIYTTGSFTGTQDFDPGPGVYNLTQPSGSGIYISKLDVNGNFVWAKQFQTWNAKSYSIALDAAGNVFTTGFYQQIADFDPGPGIFNLTTFSTGSDVFISKLDNNGNFIWAKRLGGDGNFYAHGQSLTVDAAGNVYTTGIFNGTIDFDPGSSIFNFTGLGNDDMFVSKLDANGSFIWAKQIGGTFWESGYSIAADNAGSLFLTGYFYGLVDFDPGPAIFTLNAIASSDIFILKLDVAGNFSWVKQTGGPLGGTGYSIAIDATGNIYTTGMFRGTIDIDPGPGVYNLTSAGNTDIYLSKLSSTGNFLWAKSIGGTGYDRGSSVTTDLSGNVYLTAAFQATADVDPGPATINFTSNGASDFFISRFDATGNLVWAKQVGGIGDDYSYSVRTNANGDVFTTGQFSNTVDFDPGTGIFDLTAGGSSSAFILKLGKCTNISQTTLNEFACGSYTLNNQTYTANGTYIQTLQNSLGCDSIITLNLTLTNSNDTTSIAACDNYTWNGFTYTTSGFYRDTLTNIYSCDSIINLDLTIRRSQASSINATICEGESFEGYTTSGIYVNNFLAVNGCDSIRTLNLVVRPRSYATLNATICQGENYLGYSSTGIFRDTLVAANGCDSVRTLNLLVNPRAVTNRNVAICQGESYFVGGANQITSGIYKDTLQTHLGCDSVIITNLVVNLKPLPNLGADKNLCQGQSITFNPGSFATYHWQDQTTQPTFTANTPGNYWVQVTDMNGCINADTVAIKNIFPAPSAFLKQTDTICQYEKITIAPFNSYSQYNWSNGSMQSGITVDKPGQYTLTVKDVNNCIGKDTINVIQKVCHTGVWVPTAFTPNGDQLNDAFRAMVYGVVESFRLQVFDRWGNLVFESTDPLKGWDGKVKGIPVTTSVFVWQCSYKLQGTQHGFQKGTVTVIR